MAWYTDKERLRLEEKLGRSIEEIKSLNAKIKTLEGIIKTSKSSLEHKSLRIFALKSELESYKTSFNDINKIHQAYNDDDVKENLSDKLKLPANENIIQTYIYFMQKMNVNILWDLIREQATNNHESETFTRLKDFLYLVMEEFFTTYPKYAFIDEELIADQDHLDYEVHETSKLKRGKLSSIILKGYYSKSTNNILKRSIVILK